MQFTHIYTGADGRSHFSERQLPYENPTGRSATSQVLNQPGRFIRLPEGIDSDLHNAPARQFVIFLKGSCEICCGDGSSWQGGAGDMIFVEDIEGEGHSFKELSGPIEVLFLPMPDDFDITRWA